MIDLNFRPLTRPVASPKRRRASDYGASWVRTLDDLERELNHLGARDIILEADLGLDQIRNDGWPKAGCVVATPGVRLTFNSRHGPMSFECGTFHEYTANLRAIGLVLNRLRLIADIGVGRGGEQYTGWAQLPPGRGPIAVGEWASAEDALRFLIRMQGADEPSRDDLEVLLETNWLDDYKAAARKAHPDAGGSNELMSKVNRARDYIAAALRSAT